MEKYELHVFITFSIFSPFKEDCGFAYYPLGCLMEPVRGAGWREDWRWPWKADLVDRERVGGCPGEGGGDWKRVKDGVVGLGDKSPRTDLRTLQK